MEATRSRRNRRRKRKNNNGALALAVLVLGFGVLLFALYAYLISSPTNARATRDGDLPPEASAEQPFHSPRVFPLTPTSIDNVDDTGYLMLINSRHSIPFEICNDSLEPAWPTVPVSFIEGMYLRPTVLQAVADMMDEARSLDIGSFFVSSGFRGWDTQASLYNNGANSAFVLPPGHSEHHTGLAIDILAVGVGMAEMGSSAEGRWLAENSYRYGLILRYPQGATHITGIEFEPWHFRYVGKPHAFFMRQNNLVLEEYIAHIQSVGEFSFEMGGNTYYVLYQQPQDDMIHLPTGLSFTVSGDNMGGFVVTAWKRGIVQ